MPDSVNAPTLHPALTRPHANFGKLGKAQETLDCLGLQMFTNLLFSMMFSHNHYYILARKLAAPSTRPLPRMPKVMLSLITDEDIAWIRNNIKSFAPEDKKQILIRLFFLASGFLNCYVIRDEGRVAYMQWIIFPRENDIISAKYSGRFLPLKEGQVMIENAYTFPLYRGRGYLPFATQQLIELAKTDGYVSAICYIKKDNVVSLNEFAAIGFKILKLVNEYKLFGRVWRTA